MTLAELQERLARLRSRTLLESEFYDELEIVFNAIMGSDPLTMEVLEGMGFDNAAVAGDAKRWILHIGDYVLHANQLEYSGWFFQASPIPGGHVFNLFPQPKTCGHLWQRLLELSRKEG